MSEGTSNVRGGRRDKDREANRARLGRESFAKMAETLEISRSILYAGQRLRRHAPELASEVVAGKISVWEGLRRAGLRPTKAQVRLKRVVAEAEAFQSMTGRTLRELVEERELPDPDAVWAAADAMWDRLVEALAVVDTEEDAATEYRGNG